MPELDHLRKKPPDDGGLLLDTKDRRLKKECQTFGVTFYIGPDETKKAVCQDLVRQTETKNRDARLQADHSANKESKREAESWDVFTTGSFWKGQWTLLCFQST